MTSKNRNREAPTFANINLLGKCNVDCFFCLGKDLEEELAGFDQRAVHFKEWENFDTFLERCKASGIKKIYITGQNTDSLLYCYLGALIWHLKYEGFQVGLRTNGYLAEKQRDAIKACDLSVGYSIHSLRPRTNAAILGRTDMPDWDTIIPMTPHPRVSVVLNRYNEHELMEILRKLEDFKNAIRYVQIRRVSTDNRFFELRPDIEAYERVWKHIDFCFGPPVDTLWNDADVYRIHGNDVVFWRTVKTSVNSFNYFTDGTISEMYFVVEGYLQNREENDG